MQGRAQAVYTALLFVVLGLGHATLTKQAAAQDSPGDQDIQQSALSAQADPDAIALPDRFYPGGSYGLQVGTEEFLKNYASLAGLEGVYVLLDYVFGSSDKNGISLKNDDLEDQVRQRLESVGLRMLTEDEMKVTPGMPEMAVYPAYSGGTIGMSAEQLAESASTQMCANQCCRNSVWVSFSQSAAILRRPDSQFKLGTWGAGDDSNWCENRGEWMYDAVLAVIDQFVEDYKKAESENTPVTIENAEQIPVNCAQTWAVRLQMFDTDSSDLQPSVLPILNKFATQAQRCQNYNYIIETHADRRATESYNKILTEARAAVIKEHLVSNGMNYNRIKTIAYGESKPLNDGDTEADHAENRRVVIRPQQRGQVLSLGEH